MYRINKIYRNSLGFGLTRRYPSRLCLLSRKFHFPRLKLVRLPLSLAAALAALPSISEIPFPRFCKILFILSKNAHSEFAIMQVVHFHEPNSSGAVYPTHDGGVVTGREVCDDRRFARVRRGVAAVLNVLDLVLVDDSANDRMLPVVVRGNQSPGAIVQFQCWISQGIRNAILA